MPQSCTPHTAQTFASACASPCSLISLRILLHTCQSAPTCPSDLPADRNRCEGGPIINLPALLRSIRDGGVAPHLRPGVWPLLLGLVGPEDGPAARGAKWAAACDDYARLMALAEDDGAAAVYYAGQVGGWGEDGGPSGTGDEGGVVRWGEW